MGSPIYAPIIKVVTFADPAVAGEIVITPRGGALWRIVSLAFTLTTDANVANRAVTLSADDGSNTYWRIGTGALQAAGQVNQYVAYVGAGSSQTTGGVGALPLPSSGLWLETGWRLSTVTDQVQAGDQYSDVAILIEEFMSGPRSTWAPVTEYYEHGKR